MIIDKQALFSEDQAITTTANSTNIIDLGNDSSKVQALNEKGDIELFVQVTTAFTGGTSIDAVLKSDDDVAFGSPLTIKSTGAVVIASLVQGYQFKLGTLPRINEQYLRMTYTVVGSPSAGKIFAGLILGRQTANV